jgi:hypothetical protein
LVAQPRPGWVSKKQKYSMCRLLRENTHTTCLCQTVTAVQCAIKNNILYLKKQIIIGSVFNNFSLEDKDACQKKNKNIGHFIRKPFFGHPKKNIFIHIIKKLLYNLQYMFHITII